LSEGSRGRDRVSAALKLFRVIEVHRMRIEMMEARLKEVEAQMSEDEKREYEKRRDEFIKALRRGIERG